LRLSVIDLSNVSSLAAKIKAKKQRKTRRITKIKKKKLKKKTENSSQDAKAETKKQPDPKKKPDTFENLIEELPEENRKKLFSLYKKFEEEAAQNAKKVKELTTNIQGLEKHRDDQKTKLYEMRDRLKEEVEEKESIRGRYEKEMENTKVYAISKFAKDLIEIPDNLERAIDASKALEGKGDQLYEGVKATRTILLKVLEKYGIQQINPKGEKFDPHQHEALFDYEDPKSTPGTVGQVLTVGYKIQDRILRPAKVGTIRQRD